MGRLIEDKEYKEIVLRVMVKLDSICRENGLRYMLAYGALLGAVRHGGYIPWDDDIDILMPRKDYEALRDIMKDTDTGLRFLDLETCPETIYPFAKVCDTNTEIWEHNFRPVPGLGAFVDIFPLDNLPADEGERLRLHRRWLRMIKLIGHSSRVAYTKSASWKTNFLRQTALLLSRGLNTLRLIQRLYKESDRFNDRDTGWMGVGWDPGIQFPVRELEPYGSVCFEGHEFMAPADIDAVLRRSYGDYMTLPPEEKRVSWHNFSCRYINDPQE